MSQYNAGEATSATISNVSESADRVVKGGKRATRLAFFIAGFALACWAPLVPFAQARMHADSALLGTILLCLGFGAVLGMPLASALAGRVGTKPLIIAGGFGLVITMPLLATVSSPELLGLCLIGFGASIGAIDVAANIHGIEVQNLAKTPLMSGFHGMYSLGGLIGASGMAGLLTAGVPVGIAAAVACLVILGCVLTAMPGFLITKSEEKHPLFVAPKGYVITIGALLFIIFLAEGAMLDWSAILFTQHKHVDVSASGTGYAAFAIAMAVSRVVGDKLVSRFGERTMLMFGFLVTGLGVAMVAALPSYVGVMIGMVVAGFAAGNIVPALFNLTSRQKVMPAQQAVAAVSILGYLGVLAGPGAIGHAAHYIGLIASFYSVAALVIVVMLVVPSLCAKVGH
ncbi:MFS transporter [Pseudomonas asiatica]